MSIPRAGNGSTTTQACAVCKYQRRKCQPDCILAPYFPHDRQRQFQNAHKLFGVSNITKIIKNLNPPEKDEAMRTIIFQSDMRAIDPVNGCYGIIRELLRQIDYCKAELELVLHQLAICRAQAAASQLQPGHQQHFQLQDADDSTALSEIVDPLNMYDPILQYQEQEFVAQDQHQQHHQQQQQLLQQQFQDDISAWTVQDSSVSSSPSSHIKQPSYVHECDDIKPLLDINDVKFEPDELVERKFVPSTQLVMSS